MLDFPNQFDQQSRQIAVAGGVRVKCLAALQGLAFPYVWGRTPRQLLGQDLGKVKTQIPCLDLLRKYTRMSELRLINVLRVASDLYPTGPPFDGLNALIMPKRNL